MEISPKKIIKYYKNLILLQRDNVLPLSLKIYKQRKLYYISKEVIRKYLVV